MTNPSEPEAVETTETVLRSCPFCGENKHVVNATRRVSEKWLGYSDNRDKMLTFHTIRCLTCGTEPGRIEDYVTPEAAIAAWNTRTPSSAPEVSELNRVDMLREALETCAKTFRRYGELHRAKGTAEGNLKASNNDDLAEFCEGVLADTEVHHDQH